MIVILYSDKEQHFYKSIVINLDYWNNWSQRIYTLSMCDNQSHQVVWPVQLVENL